MTRLSVVLFAVAVAVLRLAGATHPAFQAAAHLYVGGLFAAWPLLGWKNGRFLICTAASLTAVEVVAFVRSL